MSKVNNPTKVITGPNTRWSYANVWQPKSINGGAPKYSVSLIIPKSDTVTVEKVKAAIKAAYEEGESKLKGNSKTVPALSLLKTPLRDGDAERPDDPAYANSYFVNAKSSVKKYTAMQNAVCADNRVRGMFKFYGANRTGRWAGKNVQLQNLPQNHIPDLEQARELVKCGDYSALEMLYEDIPDTLSQLIRTAFVPKGCCKFIVADFSAIEARVLSWLAGEEWRSEVFKNNGDIYCASASQMFRVPVEKHGVNGHLRQKGKIAELALGYGGSVGALKAMGAIEMGLAEEELQPLVDSRRTANPNIVKFWWEVDRAVKDCVKMHIPTETHGIHFIYRKGILFIELPALSAFGGKRCGRRLSYIKPRMGANRFGGESVTYEGVGATKKWERLESYGPKFVENIVQAISRDILCYAMRNLSEKWEIVAHVHDEVIIECGKDTELDEVCRIMGRTPPFAEGLLLRADGYECDFYKKRLRIAAQIANLFPLCIRSGKAVRKVTFMTKSRR